MAREDSEFVIVGGGLLGLAAASALTRRGRQAMLAAGAPCELLPAAEAARRFPAISVPGPVLYEPESCVINASAALRSLAAALPAIREQTRVTGIADDGRRVTVSTDDGPLCGRVVILCAGPWTAGLLSPAGISLPEGARPASAPVFPAPVQRRPLARARLLLPAVDQVLNNAGDNLIRR